MVYKTLMKHYYGIKLSIINHQLDRYINKIGNLVSFCGMGEIARMPANAASWFSRRDNLYKEKKDLEKRLDLYSS